MAEAHGLALAQPAQAQAQAVVESRAEVEPLAHSRQLLVALDGGWVKHRDYPEGMEGKVGVVAPGRVPTGRGPGKLTERRPTATFAGVEAIGALTDLEAAKLGVDRADQMIVLGDGAQ